MDEILEIYTLGGLRFRRGRDSTVAFRTSKNAALAVYLACTGRTYPREVLAEMFWPERSLDVARSNLRAALTDLRKQVGSTVTVSRQTVSLLPGHACWVDAVALGDGLDQYEAFQPESELTPATRSLLQETLANYQGDFLEGFYVNSPDFENWAWMERERLRNRVTSAFDILIEYHILKAEYTAGLARAGELLQIDPLRERTIRYLMQLHAQAGDRVSALYQYDSWRGKLNGELGLEPETETAALYKDIKSGKLSPPTSNTLLNASTSRINDFRLPHPPTPFVGRENELAALVDLVTSPGARLITILGPGGIGKTRLAIAVAHAVLSAEQAAPHFADGIVFISLEAVSTSVALVSTVASTIGLQASASHSPLLDYLGSKTMLIILDNFEPLISDASMLNEMLDAAPDLQLLVTSREPLGVYGEHRFPILGLALPESDDLVHGNLALLESPAVSLFVQSARRSNPHFVLNDDDLSTAVAICRMLDGIPLAIELAASWTRLLPVVEIWDEIRCSIDFLETDLQDVPERHRNMRGVFDSVWEQLPGEERTIFAELALFVGGFSRTAAREVTGCSMRVLASLVGKSLVHYDLEIDRYSIHELLRQFCAQKRADTPDWDFAAHEKYSDYFCRWLGNLESDIFSGRRHEVLAIIEREAENVFAAWYWAVEQRDAPRLLLAFISFSHLCGLFGRFDDGEVALGAAIEWLQTVSQRTSAQQYLLAMALAWQGLIGRRLHKPHSILRQMYRNAKEILDNSLLDEYDIRSQKAYILINLAYVSPRDQVRSLQEQGLQLFRDAGDRFGEITALWAIGAVALQANDFVGAEQAFAQCLASGQSFDAAGTDVTYFSDALSWALRAQGKFAEAERLSATMLANYQRPGQPVLTAQLGGAAAALLMLQGQFSEACALAEENSLILERRRLRHLVMPTLALQARCKLHLGQYNDAQAEAEAVLRLEKPSDDNMIMSYALNVLSRVALVQGDLAHAWQTADQRMTFPFYYTRQRYEAIRLAVGAYALLLLQQMALAKQQLKEALSIAVATYDYSVLLQVLPGVALLFAIEGDYEEAVEFYSLAVQQPFVGNSVWFDEVTGSRIQAAANSNLSASRIECAQARGRHLDLWQTAASTLEEFTQNEAG